MEAQPESNIRENFGEPPGNLEEPIPETNATSELLHRTRSAEGKHKLRWKGNLKGKPASPGASARPRELRSGGLTACEASLRELILRLELLPENSRYVKHRVRCARKALQLLLKPRESLSSKHTKELEKLLAALDLNG
uniref:Uncharacterized protein n=1 Tax=Tetraselmis sp. GSL018 TaxID=582737 RepID=A0A061R842_9CHLO